MWPRAACGAIPRTLRYDNKFEIYFDTRQLVMDLARVQHSMTVFSQLAGAAIALGGAEMLRDSVRAQMRPPQNGYYKTKKRKWVQTGPQDWTLMHSRGKPRSPTRSYAWYSGTYRESLHAQTMYKGKFVNKAGMGVDRRKGKPPIWSGGRKRKNAYEYANYLEDGERGFPHRPVMTKGFHAGKHQVAEFMKKTTLAYFMAQIYPTHGWQKVGWKPGQQKRLSMQAMKKGVTDRGYRG